MSQWRTKGALRAAARWLPVPVLAGGAAALIAVWASEAAQRQEQMVRTYTIAGAVAALLATWWLLLSGVRWRLRFGVLAGLAVAGGAAALALRVRGVSGDLVPVLGWTWDRPSVEGSKLRHDPNDPPWADLPTSRVPALDSPQFRGRNRDGEVQGVTLDPDWRAHPPHEVWRRNVGEGWSSFAVAGNRAVTQEQRGELESVVCYDLRTGEELWKHGDRARYETTVGGIGPRATPAISGGRVYTLGGTGLFNCLDVETGRRFWGHDLLAANRARRNSWGVSCSPLVTGDLVIVSAGGAPERSLVAYHRTTGKLVWRAGSDRAGYSSPKLATLAGGRQVLIFNKGNLVAHDLAGGRVLWQWKWPRDHECVSMPLIPGNDRVLVSSGYGAGAMLLSMRKARRGLEPVLLWRSPWLKTKFTNPVHRDGVFYGLSDGALTAVDAVTGRRLWRGRRYGHGQVILVGDLLIVQAEEPGDVVLVRLGRTGFAELGRIAALAGKTWNPPCLAPPFLLVRNHRESACYRLKLERS